jgi:hypothetical protein
MLSDGPHAVEIEWNAASAVDAEDGDLTLWTDGVQRGQITDLDVDYRLASGRLGVPYAGGIDSGAFYFDAFESNFDHYIGLDPDALPAPPLDKPDALFADGLESGDFSAWSYSVVDGGDLSVSAQAALVGSYGMKAVLDDNVSIYVTDFSPFDETRYRGRFYFDPNTITMANNNAHYLLYALNRDDVVVARLELRRYNNTYQVRASVVNDGTSWSNSAWFTITDASHKLEIDWRASSGPGANNGGITFWVDDVQRGIFTNIDNDTRKVDYVRLGGLAGIDSGTRGTYYFDDFVSRRQSYIGMLNIPGREVAQDSLPGAAKVLAAPVPVKLLIEPVSAPQGDVVYAPLQQSQSISGTTVITYTYDPLDRLIAADYSDG